MSPAKKMWGGLAVEGGGKKKKRRRGFPIPIGLNTGIHVV